MKHRYKCRLLSQGVRTGERIALYINIPEPPLETLDDMGIRPKLKEPLLQVLNRDDGILLVSAMPGEGFTATWRATLAACDRFLRDYYVLEEKSRVEPEVINIKSITYDESKGETPFTPMPNLLLQEPNVLAFTEPTSGAVIDQMTELSEKNFLVITRNHGKHCIDALLRLIVLKPNVKRLAAQLQAVVCMRIIRKLCTECRVPYAPHPGLLKQLGIPPGRIRHFYKAFEYKPGMVDENEKEIEPCTHCSGIGYRERTGIFELLQVNDAFRRALVENPRLDHLTSVARANRHISMRDMGILEVASGNTSLEELQRVLKK
jgi:type II secretory ATPase GspE/PulE/Tfp pilus assembly ATPase PilB-like protein